MSNDPSLVEVFTPQSPAVIEVTVPGVPIVTVAVPGQQGPQGLPGNSLDPSVSGTNKYGSPIYAGQACALHSSGAGFVLANATDNTKLAIGLAAVEVGNQLAGYVQVGGSFTLPDWTQVTGTVTLAPRATYWLDVNDGRLTNTPPETRGNVLQIVGISVAPDTLLIGVDQAYQL